MLLHEKMGAKQSCRHCSRRIDFRIEEETYYVSKPVIYPRSPLGCHQSRVIPILLPCTAMAGRCNTQLNRRNKHLKDGLYREVRAHVVCYCSIITDLPTPSGLRRSYYAAACSFSSLFFASSARICLDVFLLPSWLQPGGPKTYIHFALKPGALRRSLRIACHS
jgi:hypothetical protein